jgi:uncharacterized protein (TIGR00369 family)
MSPLPPYARLLGIGRDGDNLLMPFGPHLIGAPGRLHGGAVAGLMELAANLAARDALNDPDASVKPINVTVDYLREGALADTRARAILMRLGRRVANVRVEAWQGDRNRLIAAARMNLLVVRSAPA